MKNSIEKILPVLLCACILMPSCSKESVKTLYSTQETRIESFINSQTAANPEARLVSKGGVQRLVLTEGSGDSLRTDGNIAFWWAGYVMSGSTLSSGNLFGTNSPDIAEQAGWENLDPSVFQIETLNLGEADLIPGLKQGLPGVKGGEECIILFSGQYGYGNKALGTIPANAALAYHIWVESISNE